MNIGRDVKSDDREADFEPLVVPITICVYDASILQGERLGVWVIELIVLALDYVCEKRLLTESLYP